MNLRPAPLINPGDTCWRVERANRAAFLCDNAAYFAAAKAALLKARRSILLIGWEFDHRCRLDPVAPSSGPDRIGDVLHTLALERPALDVRVLVWDAALAVALGKRMMPQRAWWRFRKSPVKLKLDSSMPRGAAHHQKLLVIDDAVAFCSGDDFSGNRWDEPDHRDQNPDRTTPRGKSYPPRHGLTLLVDGDAARALGNLARDRWRKAEGCAPAAPGRGPGDPWPGCVEPDLVDVSVGISRTHDPGVARRP